MNNDKRKLNFIKFEKIIIRNFSLFKKAQDITLDVKDGVFCLAGANGLGKSTFLNILNFGLTGIVIDPKRDFSSIVSTSKFYIFNKKFPANYFDGRIEEDDRERASVLLRFSIGENEYMVERNFFEIDELIHFERIIDGKNTIPDNLSENELFNQYCEFLTKDINLSTFDQFVFLQHFVLTFDEQHHLLFWNKNLMETSLYIFFGLNVDDAHKANNLRKKINQLSSNIRNFTYHKNRTVNEVKELESKIDIINQSKENNRELFELFDELNLKSEEIVEANNVIKRERKHSDLQIADKSIKLSNLKNLYDQNFNLLMSSEIDIVKDAQIGDFLKKLQNDILNGGDGYKIFLLIRDYIKEKVSKFKPKDELLSKKLIKIDQSISILTEEIEKEHKRIERLSKETEENKKELLSIKEKLLGLDEEQNEFLKKFKAVASNDLTGLLKSYYEQIQNREDEINEIKKEKDILTKEFKKLERTLSRNFANAEEKFIPIFQKYVESFLGLDVSIKLRNTTSGSTLIIEINDFERIDIHQLSESQRYFVDIGLRMALIQFACDTSFLLIDTPEGSLDIAYESKAGKMFAEFVKTGHNLFMTANINTSQLLIELAKECKHDKMILERMTDWTYLSKVQIQEESKIREAYKQIEESLGAR